MHRRWVIVACFVALSVQAIAQRQPPIMSRQISGQVRIGDKPAPRGVLVFLDIAPNTDMAPSGAGSIAQTTTDSSGKFFFDYLENVGVKQGREFFSVTAHYPGYRDAFQVVDLTASPRGYAVIEMQRDTSHDKQSVPPGGPAATLSASQPVSSAAKTALAKGEQLLLEKHDAPESIQSFKEVLRLEPGYAPAYVLLGTAYMQTQDWEAAHTAFEQGAKIDPRNAAAFLGIGAALNQERDYAAAQKSLLHSLELKPESAEGEYELARSFWGLGNWQDAGPHCSKALALNQDYANAHILMGDIYLRRRDAPAALVQFQEYLRLSPEGPQSGAVREIVAKIEKVLGQ